MSTLPISSNTSAVNSTAAGDAAIASSNLANQNTFMQLLIAQLQNQDPEQPTDGTQFVTELAQFTTLQEDTESATDLDTIVSDISSLMSPAATSTGTTDAAMTNPTASAANITNQ